MTNPRKLLRPPRLEKGQTAALIAPAFSFDRTLLDQGRAFLESEYGVRTVILENAYERSHYFAGDDTRRMQEIYHWLTHPDVHALLAIRGGYGCSRIYPALIKKLRSHRSLKPKIVAGYSDLTILLNGLHQDLGWITFHSPAVTGRPFRAPVPLEQKTFSSALFSAKPMGAINDSQVKALFTGKARGKLVGGCLSLLVSSLGTAYEIQTDNKILFIEDVDERPYRIDRMLIQLLHAGKLDRVRGIVFGQLTNCEPPKDAHHPTAGTTALDSIRSSLGDFLKKKKIPAIYDFPAGHGSPQSTMPIGCTVELCAQAKKPGLVFLESGVI